MVGIRANARIIAVNKSLIPSIAAYPGSFAEAARALNDINCERVHIDVVNGIRVGSLLVGDEFTTDVRNLFHGKVDLHLFGIENPALRIPPLCKGDTCILHVFPSTTEGELVAAIKKVNQMGIEVGLALDINTPATQILQFIDVVDVVLVMGIPIGARRLPLDKRALPIIAGFQSMMAGRTRQTRFGIDGGVNEVSFEALLTVTDFMVIGSLLFDGMDVRSRWKYLEGRISMQTKNEQVATTELRLPTNIRERFVL